MSVTIDLPTKRATLTPSHFRSETLDDLIGEAFRALLEFGSPNSPTRGDNTEMTGVLLELSNPRARLSRTETRGKVFSAIGELLWYLAGSDDSQFIGHYLPGHYKDAHGTVAGAYGPRLFDWKGVNQVENVITLLRDRPSSRRAVIQLFDASDLQDLAKDAPCTCTLQFFVRDGRLHLMTAMRSQDAFLGLPHDVFAFTMIQEIIARTLNLELGTYKHMVGSLHLYDDRNAAARDFIQEGYQSTQRAMPPMPDGDPWPSIATVLRLEAVLREDPLGDVDDLLRLDAYWADLVRLVQLYSYTKREPGPGPVALRIRAEMKSDIYNVHIDGRLTQKGAAP
ncbi:MAG: thymidylate synthase [Chloroflexi bacterium]|nr:thymidylate synthase [Chloroflexota bacterium]PWB46535.1 MAG: thymidylate synthase [Dehalococcoidia bacterium]